ncbi:MAG TPA: hypothetical protein VNC40_01195 [Gaiellaceae bacterium]|nr:hypothetical protein [Gaiellaceae bacterium]
MAVSAPLLAVVAASSLLTAGTLKVSVSGPTHTPKINTHWNYVVHATENGKPVAGRLTEQIQDPIGGLHPVQFGVGTKNITRVRFTGTFKDFIIWPASATGISLKLRVTVVVGKTKKIATYSVTPRA